MAASVLPRGCMASSPCVCAAMASSATVWSAPARVPAVHWGGAGVLRVRREGRRTPLVRVHAFWNRKRKQGQDTAAEQQPQQQVEEEEAEAEEEDEEEEDDEEEEWDDEEEESWQEDAPSGGVQAMLARLRGDDGGISLGRASLVLAFVVTMVVAGVFTLLRLRQSKAKEAGDGEEAEGIPADFGRKVIVTVRVPEKDIVIPDQEGSPLVPLELPTSSPLPVAAQAPADSSTKGALPDAPVLSDAQESAAPAGSSAASVEEVRTDVSSVQSTVEEQLEQGLPAVAKTKVAEADELQVPQVAALTATSEVESRVLQEQADQRKALEAEIEALRLQLAVAKEVAEHLLVGDKRREEDMGVLREQNAELSAYFENLVSQKDVEQQALAEQLAGREVEKAALERYLQDEMQQCRDLQAALAERHAQLTELEGRLKEAEEERESLTAGLRQALADCERLASKCKKLEGDMEIAKSSLGRAEAARTEVAQQLQQAEVDLKVARLSLVKESAMLAAAEEEVGEKMLALGEKQEEVERMREEIEQLRTTAMDREAEEVAVPAEGSPQGGGGVDPQMVVEALAEVQEELARDALRRQSKLAELSRLLAEAPGILEARQTRGGTVKLTAATFQETEMLRRRLSEQEAKMELFKKQAEAALAGRDMMLAEVSARYNEKLAAKEAEATAREAELAARFKEQLFDGGGKSEAEDQPAEGGSAANGRHAARESTDSLKVGAGD